MLHRLHLTNLPQNVLPPRLNRSSNSVLERGFRQRLASGPQDPEAPTLEANCAKALSTSRTIRGVHSHGPFVDPSTTYSTPWREMLPRVSRPVYVNLKLIQLSPQMELTVSLFCEISSFGLAGQPVFNRDESRTQSRTERRCAGSLGT